MIILQGVPVPVIVRLFDDALQVCEDICQEKSIAVIEALQSHLDVYSLAEYDVTHVGDNVGFAADCSCCPDAESESLKTTDAVDNVDDDDDSDSDKVDDDDISWYFDGQIQGADGLIPGGDFIVPGAYSHISGVPGYITGADGLIPGADGHIPGTDGHIPGTHGHIPGADSHIPGAHGYIPGIDGHIPGAHGHIPGTIKMEPPYSKLLEVKASKNRITTFPKTSRDGGATSSNANIDYVLVGTENYKFLEGTMDTKIDVGNMSPPWVNTRKPADFLHAPKTTLLPVERENDISKFNSERKGETCRREHHSSTPLESLESTNESVFSRKEDQCEDEDEFEASFPTVVSNTTKGNITSEIAELSIAKERNEDLFSSGFGSERFADSHLDTNRTKLKNPEAKSFRTVNKSILNPLTLFPSDRKEKKVNEKLLSFLSEKLESKNTSVERRVKISEIFKGSRHFVNNSTNEPLQKLSGVANKPIDLPLDEKSYRQTEECSTGIESMLKTSQAGKTGLVNSTPYNRETLPVQDKDGSLIAAKAKDKLKLIERNKQLLSELGCRLSHGKEHEMKLAIEVTNSSFLSTGKTSLGDFEIHLRMIHTELVLGPPSSFSQIIDGLLLESTATCHTAAINPSIPACKLPLALIDGDVTPEFRHAGLNKEFQIHRIIESKGFQSSVFSQEKDWYQRVTKSLSDHKIGLLVAKGIVQDSVLDYCSSHNITVLQSVTYPVLQLLSFATDSAIVTYLADLREQDIGRPVTIETWELGWAPSVVRQSKLNGGGTCDVRGMKTCQYVLVKEVRGASAVCEGKQWC